MSRTQVTWSDVNFLSGHVLLTAGGWTGRTLNHLGAVYNIYTINSNVECPDAVGTGKLQLLEKVMEGYVVSDIQGWLVTLLSELFVYSHLHGQEQKEA